MNRALPKYKHLLVPSQVDLRSETAPSTGCGLPLKTLPQPFFRRFIRFVCKLGQFLDQIDGGAMVMQFVLD
jgi:hypothetical protein